MSAQSLSPFESSLKDVELNLKPILDEIELSGASTAEAESYIIREYTRLLDSVLYKFHEERKFVPSVFPSAKVILKNLWDKDISSEEAYIAICHIFRTYFNIIRRPNPPLTQPSIISSSFLSSKED